MDSLIHLRNREIEKLYRNITSCNVNLRYVKREAIIDLIMESSAPRFYITPKMAEQYVLGFKKQLPHIIKSRKIGMIMDLVNAYDRAKIRHRNASQNSLWIYTVESPAKSFYVSKKRLIEIIFNYTGRNGK